MAHRDIIVIGGSAGAVETTVRLVRDFPPDLPCAVFIVVHFPPDSLSVLPRILSRAGPLPAEHATDGEPIRIGRIYVAPPNCHLMIQPGHISVRTGPRENRSRPAIDPLFRTAAAVYGPRVIGVILSGTLSDGAAGLRRIREAGGIALVQEPADAFYPDMPRNALTYAGADQTLPLSDLGPAIVEAAGTPSEDSPVTDDLISPATHAETGGTADLGAAEVEARLTDRQTNPGTPSTQTCPECHGTLWETNQNGLTQYRCRIGHAYSAENLIAHQSEVLEAALWTALRALEEHAALARRLSAKASDKGHQHSAGAFAEQAVDSEHHAAVLRGVLERGSTVMSRVAS
jgi:two-component system chemotaxis response regulator CheB